TQFETGVLAPEAREQAAFRTTWAVSDQVSVSGFPIFGACPSPVESLDRRHKAGDDGRGAQDMGPQHRNQSRTMVARPRKIRKPKKSVVAVTNTADETAGSNFSLDRVRGVSTPTLAATSRFRIMAAAMTA